LRPASRLRRLLAVFGPGLVVMLADTDVGSVITAGQSGVHWGYRMLGLQLVLIPVLFMVQELTVRLAIFTGRGHGALIRATFGPVWAWLSVVALVIASAGALLTEFSGVAGVGALYGVPRSASLPVAAGLLLVVMLTGSYRRVERVAIAVGLFELAFLLVAWKAHPGVTELLAGVTDIPFGEADYRYLAAANIGSVVMPWMVFYQQSAIADKRLQPEHLTAARWDTAIGAVVTQLIMAAVLIGCAGSIGRGGAGANLSTVGDMARALTPFLGRKVGNFVFGAGVLGAGLVAAIVVSLALAWGLGEVAGRGREAHPVAARGIYVRFYGIYVGCITVSASVVGVWPDLVSLNVAVQVMNAFMLPLVLGLLIALATRALPAGRRLRGVYLWVVMGVAAVTCALGVFGGLSGLGLV
jgi:Mn2+/Fe2+ NRAMP family transporter